MKCIFCRNKLNPYLVEQIFSEDNIEIRCGHCRKSNFITLETYLYLKKDWEMPTIEPINNKLPKDLNVMVVSNERCGISWMAKVISQVHENMFGMPIEWNYEVSKVAARKKHLPLITGWNTVNDVNPILLIERGYDRVLIVQRDLLTLLKVQTVYCHNELEYIRAREESLLRKIERYWNLVNGKEINHPRCLKIRLEDLNNYTVVTFHEILDFLTFPTFGRSVMIPISPPERNWEAYSSILPKEHELCKRLQEIDEVYKK